MILIECKAMQQPIYQAALDQASIYNLQLNSTYVWITNGHHNLVYAFDNNIKGYIRLNDVPPYHTQDKQINNQKVPDLDLWTKEAFITLLLLHAAHVDLEYSEEERSFILNHTDRRSLAQVEQFYNQHTDAQIWLYLKRYNKVFCPDQQTKEHIATLLQNLFITDGDHSKLEKGFSHFFLHYL